MQLRTVKGARHNKDLQQPNNTTKKKHGGSRWPSVAENENPIVSELTAFVLPHKGSLNFLIYHYILYRNRSVQTVCAMGNSLTCDTGLTVHGNDGMRTSLAHSIGTMGLENIRYRFHRVKFKLGRSTATMELELICDGTSCIGPCTVKSVGS
ncbi:unnamed protein product [Nesidiocoris tenuis]|uniref:Uncharacterized protein n=1 Tax=Nesidiocoris tenuis TaxID=355587 RepID=A0A6H5HC87_9HEMI|nr:unnamed protein product [Nesidiocoris tenuis]